MASGAYPSVGLHQLYVPSLTLTSWKNLPGANTLAYHTAAAEKNKVLWHTHSWYNSLNFDQGHWSNHCG
jgi:hypothetical protein